MKALVRKFSRNDLGRRRVSVLIDTVLIVVSLILAFILRTSQWFPVDYWHANLVLFPLSVLVVLGVLGSLGGYNQLAQFTRIDDLYPIFYAILAAVGVQYAAVSLFQIDPFPRSVPVIFALVSIIALPGYRIGLRQFFASRQMQFFNTRKKALIYGAGWTGVRLSEGLMSSGEYQVVGFVDDNTELRNRRIGQIPIYAPEHLPSLILDKHIRSVFLAVPSASGSKRSEILRLLRDIDVSVMTVPSMNEILHGKSVNAVRDISILDIMGREPVVPIQSLLDASLHNRAVAITGGAGSIGSELARQALASGANKIVLFDISEFGLFQVTQELTALKGQAGSQCEIVSVLGNVLNSQQVITCLKAHGIDTLYHTAAYKHVPLVEQNVCVGVYNNVIGTLEVARAAKLAEVKRFVLISTDKAVRPTNHMGASKRAAELVVQHCASEESKTIFTMVRFGNVLGSSGSVVPLFEAQLKRGGPLLVTHPDITRYFMTIPEAASLVIQAGSIAIGGEVFLLDMGEPVKIVDLAQRMIDLASPNEAVDIAFTGLRPGEKLFEELLIEGDLGSTIHPKIWTSVEKAVDVKTLEQVIVQITEGYERADQALISEALMRVVNGFVAPK